MSMNRAQIVAIQQGTDIAPIPDGFTTVTNPISASVNAKSRLAHFSEDVYDLSAESHIVKLIKVLLGGAGVGGAQRAILLAHMQQALGTTHFFDLDAFYGAILGARRNWKEKLPFDPQIDVGTPEEWDQILIRDAEYRGRIARLATAIHRGSTIAGIRGVAEALLGTRCDIHEGWMESGLSYRTWAQADALTWDQTDDLTWDEMEFVESGIPVPRHLITVRSSVPLSPAEIFDMERALDRIKPASSTLRVESAIGSNAIEVSAKAYADSSRWDVRQQVRNVSFNGLLLVPDHPEGEFISTQAPAWSMYQGEAWTLLVSEPKTVAYSIPNGYPRTNILIDPSSKQTPPQKVTSQGQTYTYVSEHALLDVQKIMAGRAVSEQIMSEAPYAREGSEGKVRVHGSTPAVRSSTQTRHSPLVIDGIALGANMTPPSGVVRSSSFWTSPSRMPSDATTDILEIRFDKEVTANVVSFKASSFPAAITVEAWNSTKGLWQAMAQSTIARSNPYVINGVTGPGDPHPYHRGNGHWVPFSFSLPQVTTTSFRIIFDRIEGYGPVGVSGRQVPYPVAVRDLDLGFRVGSIRSVPNAFPLEPISTTINTWGVDIVHRLHILGPDNAIDGSEDTMWVCDAQVAGDAVVNFYLDVSTSSAGPSAVDELWMVPTHLGPTFNLYWSDTDPSTVTNSQGEVQDRPLEPLNVGGGVTPIQSGDGGFLFTDHFESWIDLNSGDVGFTTMPSTWWTGIQWYVTRNVGRSVLASWGSESANAYNVGSIEVIDDKVIARVGNYIATVDLPTMPFEGQRLVAVVEVVDFVPTLHVQDGVNLYSETGSMDIVAPEAIRGVPITLTGTIDDDGLVCNGLGLKGAFAYGPNATAPDTTTGLDVIVQVDLAEHSGSTTFLGIAGDLDQSGWELGRTPNDDGLRLRIRMPDTSTTTASSATTDITGRWWLRATRHNTSGLTIFRRAPWDSERPDRVPVDWEEMGDDTVTAGIPLIPTGTFPIAPSMQGHFRRLIIAGYENEQPSFDATFKRYVDGDRVSRIRFGSAGEANGFRLTRLAMGLGSVDQDEFLRSPDEYTYNHPGTGLAQENIFLRYHPTYWGHLTERGISWGFMGTILEPWNGMVWRPIGQFMATRGAVQFPQVRARFLKLEISNLVVEPFDSFTVKNRPMKRFVEQHNKPSGRAMTEAERAVMEDVIAAPRFPDSPEIGTLVPDNRLSPTAALIISDSARRAEIGARYGYGYSLTSWQPSSTMGMAEREGQHFYQDVIVEPQSRIAFFCGFKEIRARRRNPRDVGDTPVYTDMLLTADNIDTASLTMNLEPGQAFTTEAPANGVMALPQSITSKPFFSYSSVDAVQIATQQTGPVQIVPDDEFSNPTLPGSSWQNTNGWHASGDAAIIWDATFGGPRVTRDPEPLSRLLVQDTPIVHPPTSPVVASVDEGGYSGVGYGEFGGITSPMVAVSPRGTLHVGARVLVDTPLGDDLSIRIYGSDGETLLAQKDFRPAVGVSTEVFMSYQLGMYPTLEEGVQIRVEQTGPRVSSWIMQSLSAFDSSSILEVSNDGGDTWMPANAARNRRYGVVEFPSTGSSLMWRFTAYRNNMVLDAVKMRPWYHRRLGSAQ